MKARGIKKFGENHFIDEGFPGNIGKTGSDQYKNRMYFLENNGYQNVTVLKKAFAIEVEDYDGEETLLHEILKDGDIIATMSKFGDKYILKAKDLSKIFKGWASVARTAKISAKGALQKDLECSSPSMAAALIAGGSKMMKSFMEGK